MRYVHRTTNNMKVSGKIILSNGNVKKLLGVLHTATDHAGELTELPTPI